jgi:oligoribonuclease
LLDVRAQSLHDGAMSTEERSRTPAYLWFDSEYTSLEPGQARLLQVALLITDPALRRLTAPARDVNLYIRLAPDAPVSAWVAANLADVLRQCRSENAVPVEEADRRLAALVDEAVGPPAADVKRRPVLAGNTVHMDLALVRMFLPAFASRLHYRLLDVSTLKILWQDGAVGPAFDKTKPGLIAQHLPPGLIPPSAEKHDAYFDIHASLAELNYYRQSTRW